MRRLVVTHLNMGGVGGAEVERVSVAQSGQSDGHRPVPCLMGKGGLSSEVEEAVDAGLDSRRGEGLNSGGVGQSSRDESYGGDGLSRRGGGGSGGPCRTAATMCAPLPNKCASFSPGAIESNRLATVSWWKRSL